MTGAKPPAVGPRKRGRPRTITDDQQIPERRRKQLRDAQQAYRQRKESTINNLQTRVDDLETGIEKLSQSFLSFSNLLIEEKLLETHPRITSALQEITRQCVSLARQSSEEPDEQASKSVKEPSSQMISLKQVEPILNFDSEIPRSDTTFSSESPSTPPPLEFNQWMDLSLPPTPPYQDQMLPFGIVSLDPGVSPSFPNLEMSLPPNTSSIQGRQWTLSHRIVQECSQNGYRLLVYTPHNLAKIQKVFGSMLSETERDYLIAGFYNAITESGGDAIDTRTKVLSPLYPKKDTFSLGQLAHTSRSWQLVAESDSGEWLDASGVQRLLQEKGIDIQPDNTQSSGFRVKPALNFDITAFIKILSFECVCVGPGPAFRRKTVEKALLHATSNDPWNYVSPCNISDTTTD